MNRSTRTALVVVLALLLPRVATAQRVIYVHAAATGAGDGMSWPDAYPHLQDALAAAESGDEIWVAEGTYRPDQGAGITPGDRQAAFVMKGGVALYGGFAGDEELREDRDWTVYPAILSGDLLQNDDEMLMVENPLRGDNSQTVVLGNNLQLHVVLDGFLIMDANAVDGRGGRGLLVIQETTQDRDGSRNTGNYLFENLGIKRNTGGGGASLGWTGERDALSSVTFRNVVFQNNISTGSGAGLYSFYSKILLDQVDFVANTGSVGGGFLGEGSEIFWRGGQAVGNVARSWGGAVHMTGENNSHLEGANLVFLDNRAERSTAGAISLDEASLHLVNSVLIGNRATTRGGALYVGASLATISNCTLVGNHAETGGGALYTDTADTVRIDNSILWGNSSATGSNDIFNGILNDTPYVTLVRNSILGEPLTVGVVDGGNVLFDDPLFVDADGIDNVSGTLDDNVRLSALSPAIDVGSNFLMPADWLDLDGDGDIEEPLAADLDGKRRVFAARGGASIVDMGAYEYGAPALPTGLERVKIPRTTFDDLDIFPNPASDRIMLLFKERDRAPRKSVKFVEVYDALGRLVRRHSLEEESGQWEYEIVLGDDMINGVYILSIHGDDFHAHKKFVVIK